MVLQLRDLCSLLLGNIIIMRKASHDFISFHHLSKQNQNDVGVRGIDRKCIIS